MNNRPRHFTISGHAVKRFRERILTADQRRKDDKSVRNMMRGLFGAATEARMTSSVRAAIEADHGPSQFWASGKVIFVNRGRECVTVFSLAQWFQWYAHPGHREPLAEGREHLTVSGKFQSDKYHWAGAGFLPLKITDPMARDLLAIYAERRRSKDPEFTRDLLEALANTSAPTDR